MAQLPSIFIYVVLRIQLTAKSHLRLLGGPCRVRKRYRVPGEEFANLCERKDTASISLHERPLCRRVVCALQPAFLSPYLRVSVAPERRISRLRAKATGAFLDQNDRRYLREVASGGEQERGGPPG